MTQNRVRDVDGETVHFGSGEGFIQSTARLPHERPAFNHFPLTWCFSHDDPVCHGRARSRHERAIPKRAVSASSERSLGEHAKDSRTRRGRLVGGRLLNVRRHRA
jgi:hypothetical protein